MVAPEPSAVIAEPAKTEKDDAVPRFGAVAVIAKAVSGVARPSARETANAPTEILLDNFIINYVNLRISIICRH
jgi:hypothetical protein